MKRNRIKQLELRIKQNQQPSSFVRHPRAGEDPISRKSEGVYHKFNTSFFKQILACARMTGSWTLNVTTNPAGFTMVMVLVAVLVLFTTVSFIKLGSMQTVEPDLRRIGINIGPNATPSNLANNQDTTTNPNPIIDNTEFYANEEPISVASSALDEGEAEAEGDNPTYIE